MCKKQSLSIRIIKKCSIFVMPMLVSLINIYKVTLAFIPINCLLMIKESFNKLLFRINLCIIAFCSFSLAALSAGVSVMPFSFNKKLSSSLRAMVQDVSVYDSRSHVAVRRSSRVCALVRTTDGGATLIDNGCRLLASIGDICVAEIPVNRLASIACDSHVCRIEAERGNALQLDSMALYTNVTDIDSSKLLPQAYTGEGVVVGLMDVGFDLTHPTFRSKDGTTLRIKKFWDQLSVDTIGSNMYVGAEYTDEQSILAYAHSRDGEQMFHGTHTLGIAAGNGAGSPYVGMAPESEVCLVSNTVSGDEDFIAETDLYRYTTATDVLGFKYLFDYAESVGKPCVVSFSEGAPQDFRGDNMLYYEALSRLVGPGRILVASAGNRGLNPDYMYKPIGKSLAGTFVTPPDHCVAFTVKASHTITMSTRFHRVSAENCDSGTAHVTSDDFGVYIKVPVVDVCTAPDSLLSDTVVIGGVEYVQSMRAYASCFDASDLMVDVVLSRSDGNWLWQSGCLTSFCVVGEDGEAEVYRVHGAFGTDEEDITLDDAVATHGILSPGSAPDVICVGATSYRPKYTDAYGSTHVVSWGVSGERGSFSSVGPTFDGRAKPDVMAPGANVISSMSSYYMEHNSVTSLVSDMSYEGRTYGWAVEGGTSMSTPAVAGIVALWLQANPYMSPDDVLGVIRRTSRPCGDYGDETPNYCGFGTVDAYAGLLDVLGLTGIEGLSHTNPKSVDITVVQGNVVHVVFESPLAEDAVYELFDLSGKKLDSGILSAGETEYNIVTDVTRGVYALQLNTVERERCGSVLVRLK